ncbi:hypothetical protein QVD17_32830 [Tagetes erecta]|uniref:C2H2-type domain-containing protein n=1 Tax=Tagetes erecta TaxID=13708 RepID=A0AAD8NJI2_TARER|nr:hypothetical protein QVD17_32830 [Tagetes erecta]
MVNNNTVVSSAGGSNPIPPAAPPPPPPPPPPSGGNKRPLTPSKTKENKSGICPICNRNLYHEKALNGHVRWHTAAEREAAGIGPSKSTRVEEQDDPKRIKVPDLNRSPPPEDGEAA